MILIYNFTSFKRERRIWFHWWCLNKWLELISWICRSSLKANYSFNWFFSKNWETKSGSYMWELLILCPFNIVFISFCVIIMICNWSVSKLFLPFKFNIQSSSCGLSPSMVILKEHIIQVQGLCMTWSNKIHMRWNIINLITNSRSNLCNMHVDQQTVISVDLKQLILGQIFGINIVLNIDRFMGQNDVWVPVSITRSFKVVYCQIFIYLVFIKAEVEITFGCNFIVSIRFKCLKVFLR